MYRSQGKMMPSLVQLEKIVAVPFWCSAFVPDVNIQVTREDDALIGCGWKKYVFELGVNVQVTREDDAFISAVGKMSHSMVWCHTFVLGVDVQDYRSQENMMPS